MDADQEGREKGRRFDPHPEEAEVVGDQGQDQGPQGSEPEARIAPGGLAGETVLLDLVAEVADAVEGAQRVDYHHHQKVVGGEGVKVEPSPRGTEGTVAEDPAGRYS